MNVSMYLWIRIQPVSMHMCMYITCTYTLYVSTSVWLDVHIFIAGHNETSTSTTSEVGAPGHTLKLAGKRLNLLALYTVC